MALPSAGVTGGEGFRRGEQRHTSTTIPAPNGEGRSRGLSIRVKVKQRFGEGQEPFGRKSLV